MKCSDCIELVHYYIDNSINPLKDTELAAHIETCEECKAEIEFYRTYKNIVSGDEDIEVPANYYNEISIKVTAETNAGFVNKIQTYIRNNINMSRPLFFQAAGAFAVVVLALVVFKPFDRSSRSFIPFNEPSSFTDSIEGEKESIETDEIEREERLKESAEKKRNDTTQLEEDAIVQSEAPETELIPIETPESSTEREVPDDESTVFRLRAAPSAPEENSNDAADTDQFTEDESLARTMDEEESVSSTADRAESEELSAEESQPSVEQEEAAEEPSSENAGTITQARRDNAEDPYEEIIRRLNSYGGAVTNESIVDGNITSLTVIISKQYYQEFITSLIQDGLIEPIPAEVQNQQISQNEQTIQIIIEFE
jgi:hypothetical protein